MGADLIISRLPLDFTHEEAIARMDRVPLEAKVAAIVEQDMLEEEEEIAALTPYVVEQRLLKALETVYDYNREVTHLPFDGKRIWALTGGMSWGDMPTESGDDFELLAALPITYEHWDRHLALEDAVLEAIAEHRQALENREHGGVALGRFAERIQDAAARLINKEDQDV